MQCKTSKWCQWIQGGSQLAIAAVIVYAGYTVNNHMEDWTESFKRGSDDLHNISVAMNDIKQDMDIIRIQMDGMNIATRELSADFKHMNKQVREMNSRMSQMQYRMSPRGMMRGMMPW